MTSQPHTPTPAAGPTEDEVTHRYSVRIHDTRGHTLYVDAENEYQARDLAIERWLSGDDGDPMEEDSVSWEIASIEIDSPPPTASTPTAQETNMDDFTPLDDVLNRPGGTRS